MPDMILRSQYRVLHEVHVSIRLFDLRRTGGAFVIGRQMWCAITRWVATTSQTYRGLMSRTSEASPTRDMELRAALHRDQHRRETELQDQGADATLVIAPTGLT